MTYDSNMSIKTHILGIDNMYKYRVIEFHDIKIF